MYYIKHENKSRIKKVIRSANNILFVVYFYFSVLASLYDKYVNFFICITFDISHVYFFIQDVEIEKEYSQVF